MAGSVNKVILVGNLGRDPEVRSTQDGKEIVSFSIATSESWKDRNTGERKERTEWHRIVVFNENLARVSKDFLRKGSKVYLEGQLQTRKWVDNSGQEKYTTEIVLQGFNAVLTMLDGKRDGNEGGYAQGGGQQSQGQGGNPGWGATSQPQQAAPVLDDEIPF